LKQPNTWLSEMEAEQGFDAVIARIVQGWPRNFDAAKAGKLGFKLVERDFDDIIRFHIDDELAGRVS